MYCTSPYDTVTVYLVYNMNKYQQYTMQGVDLSRFLKAQNLM